jgi:two-component system, LuxR family, sensor kinase FixL
MSWITVVWSINVGACLTLATMYLAVWCRERESFVRLLFSCIAASAALIAAYELQLIRADTPEEYGAILRWRPLSTWVLVLSLVAFTRLYLHAGRSWMALSACGLQTLTVIVNFAFTPNLYYEEITAVRQLPLGGEMASIPLGTPSPWSLLNQATLLLLLAFFVDATITVWRRGDRERALIVGGTTTFFGAIVAAQFALVILGIIQAPFFASFAYLGIVVALGYQLCNDAIRAADLASELQVGEERFRRVVEAAPNAMIMVNQEGQITLANQQAEKTFGYPREELLGGPIEMLLPERVRSDHEGFRHDYLCDPQARPMGAGRELFGRRKDGSEVPVEIGLSPIHTSKGPLVLASIVDITERKLAELEAARQRHDLAHLARVSTVGELSSSLAHELTHPITAILSNAQAAQRFLAQDDIDLDEVREILNDIVTQDQRAGEVIHGLRLLLKKGEPQKHCDDVDLNEVIRDVVNLMRGDLINRNVTVDTDLAQNLPAVTGDRVQLQQVLLNLALNGCDAMADYKSSERRLLIASQCENGAVRVSVSDSGSGIPREKMEQVFERFFTTKKKGMGLGLSVCRTIINAHHGKIWATNNAGCGATFHFSLPIVGAGKEAVTTDQLSPTWTGERSAHGTESAYGEPVATTFMKAP